jgi:hypothetical protein
MVPDFRWDDVWTPAFAGVTIQDTFCDAINIGYDPFSRYGLLPKFSFLRIRCTVGIETP